MRQPFYKQYKQRNKIVIKTGVRIKITLLSFLHKHKKHDI